MRIGPISVATQTKIRGLPGTRVAAGWGALRELARLMLSEKSFFRSAYAFLKQNKLGGFICVSCAWAKPRRPQLVEICESGGKATAWELTRRTAPVEFFENHTLRELENWRDHDLEKLGRLTHPLKWDAVVDCTAGRPGRDLDFQRQ